MENFFLSSMFGCDRYILDGCFLSVFFICYHIETKLISLYRVVTRPLESVYFEMLIELSSGSYISSCPKDLWC